MTEFILVIIVFYSTKTACEQAIHLCVCVWEGGGGGVGGGGAMRSRESSTQKDTRVQGSPPSPYKMERLLRWLCSTQASGHLFCFSPCTYFSTLLYLALAPKALKGNL